jgi:glycosyltransferase involved in cell wall biosynthesis
MKVLLIGHACGPGMGSEPGGTWNWALHLARHHDVWVITHPQFRDRIEAYLVDKPNLKIEFVWVDVKSILDPWVPTRGERGIQVHYILWLKVAYSAAERVCKEKGIDVAHHVSWGTIRAAPPLWQLPVPSIWGPVGGGQCAPTAFLRYFGLRAVQEILRDVVTRSFYLSSPLRKAAQRAALVLVTNRETQRALSGIRGVGVELMLDCGSAEDWLSSAPPAGPVTSEFTLLWAGRLEHRKALSLALEALAKVKHIHARLLVAGSGALRASLEKKTTNLGLAGRVDFLGSVPHATMQSLFARADAFLFTSLRDSFGSVVLEAMARGLPIIALDHHGVGSFVPDEAGIKVAVTTPKKTVEALAAAIETMNDSPALLSTMRLASWTFAKNQTWTHRAEQMTRVYEDAVSRQCYTSSFEEGRSTTQAMKAI